MVSEVHARAGGVGPGGEMSITIRECGHSAETSSKAYVKNPDLCVSCAWIAKHGPPKRLYVQNLDIEKRARQAKTMRNVWKARKARLNEIKAV